jgi:hypothetical protein
MQIAFELHDDEHIVGFIYAGYPDMPVPKGKRTPYEEKTVWITK